jgi:hypothetical protein
MKKFLFIILLVFHSSLLFSQASTELFGQNRIQYRNFEWKYYDSTHFRVFFYDYGKALGQYVLNNAEKDLPNIAYMMGGRLTKKLNLVIYNSFADFKQTNIGIKNDALNLANGGKVDIASDNIAIYFNGDHEDLKRQVRYGVSNVIKDNMLFGETVKEAVKNAIKMNLPEWYTSGYVTYVSDEWTAQKQTEIVNIASTSSKSKLINFNAASSVNPTLIGHSFWNFIEKNYSEGFVSNLLYLTRSRKSVNDALIAVTGKTIKEIFKDWQDFYTLQNVIDSNEEIMPARNLAATLKAKGDVLYSNFTCSPNGKEIAFLERKDGQFYIQILNAKNNKIYNVMDGGMRALSEVQDPNYPLFSWSTDGGKLAILHERNNMVRLKIFNNKTHRITNKVLRASRIERVTGMCFAGDDNTLIFTAIKKGQSDVYKYLISNNRATAITNDLFDDVHPTYVTSGAQTGILFMSNRTTPYIGENSKSDEVAKYYHAFFYNEKKTGLLTPLSSLDTRVYNPIQYNDEQFAYLKEENGRLIRKIITLEKRIDIFDTFKSENTYPLKNSILHQDYNAREAKLFEVIKTNNQYQFYYTSINKITALDAEKKLFIDSVFVNNQLVVIDTIKAASEYETSFDNTDSSSFLEDAFKNKKARSQSNIQSDRYIGFTNVPIKLKSKEYIASFYPDFLQTTVDNSILFTRYQPVAFNNGGFNAPPISGFLSMSLNDIMEDYKITGGVRVASTLRGFDYFLQYKNSKHKNDWGLLYYHTGQKNQYELIDTTTVRNIITAKVTTNYFQGNYTIPTSASTSIRLFSGIRLDKFKSFSENDFSLRLTDSNQIWSTSRFEYVFDNAVSPIFNIWKGTRVKLFAEYLYKLNKKTEGCYNLGIDARNYLKLYKNIVFCSRLSFSHSGGDAKILYYIGGVDNAIAPKTETNITLPADQNYAFQTLGTNLRGFKQGAYIGNSFMLINEEIRLPIYNTFFKRPIRSTFLRSLQLITFADIGSAWNGLLPNETNRNLAITLRNGNFVASIDKIQDLALGYGTGLRAKVFGYFARVDLAWQYGFRKPMWHFSLATDF